MYNVTILQDETGLVKRNGKIYGVLRQEVITQASTLFRHEIYG